MTLPLLRICPSCTFKIEDDPYDIGDGPEFCCPECDWCWGAPGQPLTDGPINTLKSMFVARAEGAHHDA